MSKCCACDEEILCIPGSQAENEQIFFTAGILSKPRRVRMSAERLDDVLNIYTNIRDCSSLYNQPQFVGVDKTDLDSLIDREFALDDRVSVDSFKEYDEL